MGTDMTKPVAVEPRDGFRIWIKFQSGEEGEINLSHLAGRGVLGAWADRRFFESVTINSYGEIAWGDVIDLCPDALYMQLTGKTVEEVMPGYSVLKTNA